MLNLRVFLRVSQQIDHLRSQARGPVENRVEDPANSLLHYHRINPQFPHRFNRQDSQLQLRHDCLLNNHRHDLRINHLGNQAGSPQANLLLIRLFSLVKNPQHGHLLNLVISLL